MEFSLGTRMKHAWNAFTSRDPTELEHAWNAFASKEPVDYSYGGYSYRPDRPRLTRGNEQSIMTSILNRIALDAAAIAIRHVRLDENERFLETVDSKLNSCLSLEANIDQSGRAFMHDVILSMLDEGHVVMLPVETTFDPKLSNSYDILSMRTAKVANWYPKHVQINAYDDISGTKKDLVVPKKTVAIIENPLYAVMNGPSSTLQRLKRKLILLDAIDEQSGSGKLDLIIQLPYIIKSDARKAQAEQRRKDIETQLAGSKYGIAYTDGTEHITQLNRPVENNLMKQIEYLTNMLYSQLGITQSILDGTADEKTMLNYYTRTIEPILSAIVDEMKRKFLTKTARTQGQSIMFFRDPFKLVPVNEMAEIADKFTRNEIMSSNEIRQSIGMKPSDDPRADELVNKNLSSPSEETPTSEENPTNPAKEEKIQNGEL